jgi:glycosyltransferase involved in cell wall biosynthesis
LGHLIKEVTVTTPFFNEESGIDNFFKIFNKINKLLKSLGVKGRYIFINDGSTDKTLVLLKKFKFKNKNLNIKIINHRKNYGYGRTLRTSLSSCDTKYMITYDSDCTYDYNLIKNLIKNTSEKTDIINVSYKLSKKKEDLSLLRKLLSWGSSVIYLFFFYQLRKSRITVFTCSFRIYNVEKIKNIKIYSNDFNACGEIIIKSVLNNFNIKEIPGNNLGRKYGYSKMKILRNIVNTLRTIILIKLNY